MTDEEQLRNTIAELQNQMKAQHMAILDLSDAMLEISAGAMRSSDPEMKGRGQKAFAAVGRVLLVLDHANPEDLT